MDFTAEGEAMFVLIRELYPICRSITGEGLRRTLRLIQRQIPVCLSEVPTNTRVFDWTVPKEWNIRDAWVKNSRGERVIDFQRSNLHVVNYSTPVRQKMSLAELKPHLHTLPGHPDWIPYRTSYYKETWGFCLTHNQFLSLAEDEYEVSIDSTLAPGSLTYAELFLPGDFPEEILISCHACHPSLCNDNLSGLAVATHLAGHLAQVSHRYSYRFLFIPGTIGSITWLSRNEDVIPRIRHGLVLSCLGDRGGFSYKRSRQGHAEIDRAVAHAMKQSGVPHQVQDFSPYGYDERQYCSPAFDLPVGRLSRTSHGCFPEYHTSADNLDFVRPECLAESLRVCLEIFALIENNRTFLNLNPKCEPHLGKRGLYRSIGGFPDAGAMEMAMLWVLNLSDGGHTLLDIAERANLPLEALLRAVETLREHDLLREAEEANHSAVAALASRKS